MVNYDIYGDELRSGHCEVHPFVHEPFPCYLCMMQDDENQRLKNERDKLLGEQYNRYCEEIQERQISEQQGLMGDGI